MNSDELATLLTLDEDQASLSPKREREESSAATCTSRSVRTRLVERRFRFAEAVAETSKVHPLERARVLFARGKFSESRKELHSLESETFSSPLLNAEILLERARLANAEGNWEEAIQLSTEALNGEHASVSKIALFQIRSIGYFGARKYDACRADIDVVRTLALLYPNSITAFYAQALEVQTLSRMGMRSEALKKMRALWTETSRRADFHSDHLLTLLRTQIELKKASGQTIVREALLTYRIAEQMGDEAYTQLALAEMSWIPSTSAKTAAQSALNLHAPLLPRVRAFLDRANVLEHEDKSDEESFLFHWPRIRAFEEKIVLIESETKQALVYDFKSGSISTLSAQSRVLEALEALGSRSLSKEEFFQKVWKISKFRSETHDEGIRTLLKRVRKQTGLSVTSHFGVLSLESATVISC